MSFSHHPTRRMKFNAVAAGFFTSQPSSGDISKFPHKMRRFISKSLAKNKDFNQPYFIFQRVFSGLTGRFGNRGKSRGGGTIIRFSRRRESDSLRAWRCPGTLTIFRLLS
jgi:hypothetical protein